MKSILFALFLSLTAVTYAQTPCTGNTANGFPCENFNLQSRITPGQMDASFANDSWGWIDPVNGKEYALIGLNNGTAFIDISDPVNPVYVGKLPTHNGFIDGGQVWRDLKVYNNHVFVVSEIDNHGMQVFDLTRLRDATNVPEVFTEDAHFDGFGSAHNIVINEETGFAYGVGATTFSGGIHFVNIQDPTNPISAGGYAADGYTHDAQVLIYDGPDTDHTGKEIFIGSNGDFGPDNKIVVIDVSDKNNPQTISEMAYPNMSYAHQGWFTEDKNYFLLGDEIDEQDSGFNTRTIIFDVSDLDNPAVYFEYFGTTAAIDHNGYVVDNKFYMAAYNAGLRVLDISDIANQNISEYGYFDTFPDNNQAGFSGAWNVYPFFPSRNIVISGDAGFTLVLDPTELSVTEQQTGAFAIFPNPAKDTFTVTSSKTPITKVEIFNLLGQQVYQTEVANQTSTQIAINNLTTGMYMVKVNNSTSQKLIVK
ncbi:MAG: regulator [Flavobacteriaceae bacterium]|nr:regulator [Flavobacteriaceae bacterium]